MGFGVFIRFLTYTYGSPGMGSRFAGSQLHCIVIMIRNWDRNLELGARTDGTLSVHTVDVFYLRYTTFSRGSEYECR